MTTPLLYTLVIAPTEMGNEIELLRFPTRYAPSAGAYAHWVLSQAFEEGEDGYEDYIRQIFDFETATYDRETCTLRGITPDGHTDAFSANDAAGIMRRGSWWHKSYDHGIAWRTLHVDPSTVETLPVLPEIGEQFLMSTTNWDVGRSTSSIPAALHICY
jgi:hypothetical protein